MQKNLRAEDNKVLRETTFLERIIGASQLEGEGVNSMVFESEMSPLPSKGG